MKARWLWICGFGLLFVAAAILYFRREPAPARAATAPPAVRLAPRPASHPLTTAPAPAAPASASTAPSVAPARLAAPPPEVPIQDGATLDFSIGAPVVRSGGADTEALARALKEMEEATKNATFEPRAPEKAGAAPAK